MDIPYLPGLPFMGKTGCGPVGNESKRFTKQFHRFGPARRRLARPG
jgi:hypothetical protein